MTEEMVLQLGREAMITGLLISAPILGVALVVGLVIGVFQAATQINEATLSFVPKILGVLAALALAGPWMIATILDFTVRLVNFLPNVVP